MSMEPLKRLGKYELRELLGHGGMAEVWKAFDTQLKRYVAIKILHPKLLEDPNFVTRFELEAQLIASLHHPNIVQIHDFQVSRPPESTSTLAYMVMAYIEGETLASYIGHTSAQGKIPSPVEIVNLFTSISLAIDYAHGLGMVHRDIKPANILLDKTNTTRNSMGEPILTDFGLAKLLGVSASTFTANQLGTPLYTSPEQARGYAGNERSDLYSLGVILYEMVTGVQPFRGSTPIEVLSQHLNATPTSPVLLNPNIPPALTMVIVTALAKDPNARFSSAATMTAAIAESLKVPVPEVLGQPAYPRDFQNMPTYIGAPVSQGGTSLNPSSSPSLAFTSPAVMPSSSNPGPVAPVHATPQLATPTSSSWQPGSISASGGPTEVARSQNMPPAPVGAIQESATPPAAIVSTPATASKTSSSPPKRQWKGWYTALVVLLIVALFASGLSAFLVVHNRNSVPAAIPGGQAFFLSSGQINPHTSQGIADQLEIDLHTIPEPQAGKSYYAWLLADRRPTAEKDLLQPPPLYTLPLLLGKLSVNHGNVSFFYQGTAHHDDLFALSSRLLITEEDTNGTPRGPAADRSAWVYYAEIPQTPYGPNHLSALDHIRHLFYKETVVNVLGLSGGLDNWLYKNTEKVMEWSISARDDYHTQYTDITTIHNLFVEILDYLDGSANVHLDAPGDPIIADSTISKVALLSVVPAQKNLTDVTNNPPGYLFHIQLHLQGVVGAPDATPQMRVLASKIIQELTNATGWLNKVRADAQQLVKMDAAQLSQPSTQVMLDDMLANATYAYIGQLNPSTNLVVPGVLQVHYDIQKLATLNITPTLPKSI
jgi:eukaryotic-like serine/threonine-protein kinase